MGIEPTFEAWEAPVLPLNYTRITGTGDYITALLSCLGLSRGLVSRVSDRLACGRCRRALRRYSNYNTPPAIRVSPNVYAYLGDKLAAMKRDVMKIILNGEEKAFYSPVTVTDLLADMGMRDKRVAVEVNLEIVPRSEHGQFQLKNADRVEVVHAIGGG